MAFDPDKYISENIDTSGFDPDAYLQEAKPKEEPGMLEAGARAIEQGATLGWGDELNALLSTLAKRKEGQDFGEQYKQELGESRKAFKAAEEAHPYISLAGNLAGGLVMPGASLGMGIKGLKAAEAIGKMAKAGAVIGGVAGLGGSESGDVGEALKETAKGATIGGVAGGALQAATPAVEAIHQAVSPMVKQLSEGVGSSKIIQALKTAGKRGLEGKVDTGEIGHQGLVEEMESATGKAMKPILDQLEVAGKKKAEFLADKPVEDMSKWFDQVEQSIDQLQSSKPTFGSKQGEFDKVKNFINDYRESSIPANHLMERNKLIKQKMMAEQQGMQLEPKQALRLRELNQEYEQLVNKLSPEKMEELRGQLAEIQLPKKTYDPKTGRLLEFNTEDTIKNDDLKELLRVITKGRTTKEGGIGIRPAVDEIKNPEGVRQVNKSIDEIKNPEEVRQVNKSIQNVIPENFQSLETILAGRPDIAGYQQYNETMHNLLKLKEQIPDLKDIIQSGGESIQGILRQKEFKELGEQIQNLAKNQPDVYEKLISIPDKLKRASELANVLTFEKKPSLGEGVIRGTLAHTKVGMATAGANIAGRGVTAAKEAVRNLHELVPQEIDQLASAVAKGVGFGADKTRKVLSNTLKKVSENPEPARRAMLFAIQQNPAYREILRSEGYETIGEKKE